MASNNVFVLDVDDYCEEEGNEAINDGEQEGEMANYTSGMLKSDIIQRTSSA